MTRPSRNTILALIATFVYGVLALYKVLHHVFWEDEWQMWLTARSQSSALAVAMCSRYDGHPPFWYLVQYVITRFSHDVIWLKLLHVALATAIVYVIWRYGPFSLVEKILLPLGYFLFFEFSTISRCYVPGVLLAVIAMVMFPSSRNRPMAMAILLFCLGQISLFGIVLSLAIATAVAVDWWQADLPRRWWVLPVSMLASLTLFYFCTRLPPDSVGAELWINGWARFNPVAAGAHLFDAYFPIPKFTQHWWNTQVLPLSDLARAVLGLGILGAAAFALRRFSAAVALLVSGSVITLGVLALVYTGEMRHWGHFFILLVLAVWAARIVPGARPAPAWGRHAFLAVLIIQVFAGITASIFDLRQPFSATPQAAAFIRQFGPDVPVAGDYDNVMNALVGELDRPIFFLRSGEFRWFTRFDMRRHDPDYDVLKRAVTSLSRQYHSDVLLVLTYPIPMPPAYKPVATIPPGTVEMEQFYIYLYRYDPGS